MKFLSELEFGGGSWRLVRRVRRLLECVFSGGMREARTWHGLPRIFRKNRMSAASMISWSDGWSGGKNCLLTSRVTIAPAALFLQFHRIAGMHQYQYDRLQSVLRAAARLVLRLPKWASVSEAMREKLHWLPYPERVEFKQLCSTIYKCLHNSAPQYLMELCIPVATLPGRCHLRSAAYGDLFVPATYTKTIGPRGFSYAGPVALEQSTTCS